MTQAQYYNGRFVKGVVKVYTLHLLITKFAQKQNRYIRSEYGPNAFLQQMQKLGSSGGGGRLRLGLGCDGVGESGKHDISNMHVTIFN